MAGMWLSSDYQLFRTDPNRSRIRRFNDHVSSSTPLHFSVIALYGAGLTLGLAVTHDDAIVEELDDVTPDLDSP